MSISHSGGYSCVCVSSRLCWYTLWARRPVGSSSFQSQSEHFRHSASVLCHQLRPHRSGGYTFTLLVETAVPQEKIWASQCLREEPWSILLVIRKCGLRRGNEDSFGWLWTVKTSSLQGSIPRLWFDDPSHWHLKLDFAKFLMTTDQFPQNRIFAFLHLCGYTTAAVRTTPLPPRRRRGAVYCHRCFRLNVVIIIIIISYEADKASFVDDEFWTFYSGKRTTRFHSVEPKTSNS